MKILLIRHHDIDNINTRFPQSMLKAVGIFPPLGILYIASVLEKNGYNVEVLDSQALNLTTKETQRTIEKIKPDVVGVTSMTPNIRGTMEAAKLAKGVSKDIITVLGGSHLSVYPKETVAQDFVDYGIVGEGEYAFLELIKALEENESPTKIKGLAYKKNGKVVSNTFRIVEELDELPFPSRHLIPTEKYQCIIAGHPFTTLITSRGCPYRCGFCFKGPSDRRLRFRNPKSVVDEMEFCVEKFKVKEIMIYDDTFTLKKLHVEEISKEIIKRGLDIKWEAPTRVDLIDEKLVDLMKRSGCIRLRMGVESGNEEILKIMKKGITLEQAEKAFKTVRKVGIEAFAYFIIGYAHENEKTIRNTINFAKKLDPDWALFTVATPLPDTELFQHAVDLGLVKNDYWKEFADGKTNERIPYFVPNADEWTKIANREFYLRPTWGFKKLFKIRSIRMIKQYINAFNGIIFYKMIN